MRVTNLSGSDLIDVMINLIKDTIPMVLLTSYEKSFWCSELMAIVSYSDLGFGTLSILDWAT